MTTETRSCPSSRFSSRPFCWVGRWDIQEDLSPCPFPRFVVMSCETLCFEIHPTITKKNRLKLKYPLIFKKAPEILITVPYKSTAEWIKSCWIWGVRLLKHANGRRVATSGEDETPIKNIARLHMILAMSLLFKKFGSPARIHSRTRAASFGLRRAFSNTWATTGASSSGEDWLGDMNSAMTRFSISEGGKKTTINRESTLETLWLLHLFPDFNLNQTNLEILNWAVLLNQYNSKLTYKWNKISVRSAMGISTSGSGSGRLRNW